jgi:N-methylhydantoinase B
MADTGSLDGPSTALWQPTDDGVLRHDEVDRSRLREGYWNGRINSYIPPAQPVIHPSVRLSQEFEAELDPVTSEILRWRLWNINLEHSETIKRAAGTEIVSFSDDYNTSILTEVGDTVLGGPTIQYFVGAADCAVKWTLENRSASPGISDGDMFLNNDPWVGCSHQMDVAILAPIFWDGELFSWVFSAAHQRDIGGVDPGSFCLHATDVYGEPTLWPSVRLVSGGELNRDVMDLFCRQSRSPEMCELQLRAQIAGVNTARARMAELLQEYGPRQVKGAMRKAIKDASRSVGDRLRQLPDGEWQHTTFVTAGEPSALRKVVMNLRKEGELLVFGNAGTDAPFSGSGNGTYVAFRSGALSAASALLAWDHLYCIAGVLDHMRFEPDPDTCTMAPHPAAVTLLYAPILAIQQAGVLISRMLLSGPAELRGRAFAAGAYSSPAHVHPYGLDAEGQPFYGMTGDSMAGGFGAFPERDGIDIGGTYYWPRSNAGNAEEWESRAPMIYLYRRIRPGSGGPGAFRGGNAAETALLGHKATSFQADVGGNHPSVNTSSGLAGGLPGHLGDWRGAGGTGIREVLASGRVPSSPEELEAVIGELPVLRLGEHVDLGNDGVLVVQRHGGGGYGDPLSREPESVVADLESGAIPRSSVEDEYGVVLVNGTIDAAASREVRNRRRRERRSRALAPRTPLDGRVDVGSEVRPFDGVRLLSHESSLASACSACGQLLARGSEDFRSGAAHEDLRPSVVSPARYRDSGPFAGVETAFRFWYCPACGVQLLVELVREDETI